MTKKKSGLPDLGFNLRQAETTEIYKTARLTVGDKNYQCRILDGYETKGHKPADVLKETCIMPVIETEEDYMIISPAEAKVAKAQGYRLDAIMRSEISGKILAPQEMRKRFNVIATEDLNIGGKSYRSYQPAGDVLLMADSCNYQAMLDAGIAAIAKQGLITPVSDMHFGMRMSGEDIITIDFISNQPKILKADGRICREAKDTVFPMFINHIKTDMYPKYIIDGRMKETETGTVRDEFMARLMQDDDLIPLHYNIAIVSTYHGLMQIVFWGDITLEEMAKVGVYYMYDDKLFHTVFDGSEPFRNYLVIDSLSEFTTRRGITVGDPIIPIRGFNFEYEAWGGAWWDNKEEPAAQDSEHEIGKKAKEQNIETARAATTGKNPASSIMKKLLRSKE